LAPGTPYGASSGPGGTLPPSAGRPGSAHLRPDCGRLLGGGRPHPDDRCRRTEGRSKTVNDARGSELVPGVDPQ
jgi:hypothetical protein